MADRDGQRDRELLLSPNEFSFVRDQATGAVNVLVGTKKTLDPGDTPVTFDIANRRFRPSDVEGSKQVFVEADESSYIVLRNPASDGKFPTKGTNSPIELAIGSKVNIPGPKSFPLWPLQIAEVIPGHQLRSNQYVTCKVYNEKLARENLQSAVVKTTDGKGGTTVPEIRATGQLIIIKGTDVSFFIPPTGIEVLPEVSDGDKVFVRNAETLERLEYCVLLDESGVKRYVKGPAVVFPSPTEIFVTKNGTRKFRAIEMNDNMALHIKVIADYEEDGVQHKVGEELFVTGKDQKIYFPREEHQIIKYGGEYVTFAIAIPQGEGRYVLNKETGEVATVKGTKMFLPDPRKEVVVRRALDSKTVNLWFPGNQEAEEINRRLAEEIQTKAKDYYSSSAAAPTDRKARSAAPTVQAFSKNAFEDLIDAFERKTEFTPPRTLTLNTKYDGVVTICPWTGYAVQIVPKVGERKVVVGPATILMEYDWDLEVLTLSTGTPKSDDKTKRIVYLRIQNNTVSDRVTAVTKNDIQVQFDLKYVINFEGDPNKWFNVENYIALLTDRLRSMIYNMVKTHDVEDFKDNAAVYLRDLILGKKNADGKREGGVDFSNDNGMVIKDVTVSPIKIGNDEIDKMILRNQYDVIANAFRLKTLQRQAEIESASQKVAREMEAAKAESIKASDEFAKLKFLRDKELESAKLEAKKDAQDVLDTIHQRELNRQELFSMQEIRCKDFEMKLRIAELEAETKAFCSKFQSIQPDLVAAIQSFGEKELAAVMARNLPQATGSLGLLLGQGGIEALKKMVAGTPMAKALESLAGGVPASK